MPDVRLLPGEKLEAKLRPHPVSFLGHYFVAAWFALWAAALAWLFRTAWWRSADDGKWFQFWTFLYGNTAAAYVYMVAGMALVGVVFAVARIRWRIFFAYVAVGGATIALTVWLGDNDTRTAMPLLLGVWSVPAVLGVEMHRRSHEYHLTNLRILFRGGIVVTKERQLKFEAITDLDGTQGPLARLLDYGTLIPVTQSGFGLGADISQAMMGVGLGASKGGVAGGLAVGAGGGKEVQTGRARSFHQLTGIKPYRDTKYLLERLVQEATATPYLRQQVELQRQMVQSLSRLGGEPPLVEGQRVE